MITRGKESLIGSPVSACLERVGGLHPMHALGVLVALRDLAFEHCDMEAVMPASRLAEIETLCQMPGLVETLISCGCVTLVTRCNACNALNALHDKEVRIAAFAQEISEVHRKRDLTRKRVTKHRTKAQSDRNALHDKPAERKTRAVARNEILDAVALLDGAALDQVPPKRWSHYNSLLNELKAVCPDVSVAEIRARGAEYRRQHPTWDVTAAAVVKHWGSLSSRQSSNPFDALLKEASSV